MRRPTRSSGAGRRIAAGGRALAWTRDPLNVHAFQVDVPPGTSTLDIAFQQLLSADGGNYSSLVSRELIQVQWGGTVLAPAGYDASRVDVDPSLRVAGPTGDALRFERVSLETLVDSPVFAGKQVKRISDALRSMLERIEGTPDRLTAILAPR